MDRMEMEANSLQKRIIIIRAEGFELDKRANEAVSTYGTNVLVIMLFLGLSSIFLQLNYPYFGTSVSVLMVVSFFSTFVVAYIVSSNNIEKISEKEKDLWKRQREFQSDIAFFGAQITRAYSDEELNTLASIGALGEVLNGNGSLTRDARALQSTIASLLEMSSNSESNRMKSLFQVKVCAIIYRLQEKEIRLLNGQEQEVSVSLRWLCLCPSAISNLLHCFGW
ncbi:hypothetical protein RHSIM_RhsimUnG0083800 [Rhododendron simsii]|uniref:Uncharacterized protein n=1 Tax=Rhododendron simsii TaxID=118357 RepID=A0A834L540_RHOSS|nr:hypothetical protein RHSIM_RhsimUnG0083800 [Rhododendron simsii]